MNIPELSHFQNALPKLSSYLLNALEQFNSHHMTTAKRNLFIKKLHGAIFDEWTDIVSDTYQRSLDVLNTQPDRENGWYLSPFDNVTQLKKGCSKTAMTVGYFKNSRCVAALIYLPEKDTTLLVQQGKSVSLNQKRIRLQDTHEKGDVIIGCTSDYLMSSNNILPTVENATSIDVCGSQGLWLSSVIQEHVTHGFHSPNHALEKQILILFLREAALFIEENNDVILTRNKR